MNLVPTVQSQVLHKHLDLRVFKFLGFQIRGVEVHCIIAFSGNWLMVQMDRVNLKSFNLEGHTSIES